MSVAGIKRSIWERDGVPVEFLHMQMAGKSGLSDQARVGKLRLSEGGLLTVRALSGEERGDALRGTDVAWLARLEGGWEAVRVKRRVRG